MTTAVQDPNKSPAVSVSLLCKKLNYFYVIHALAYDRI